MEKLMIQQGIKSPLVTLDPASGIFELKGNSIPEDANAFFKPVFQKLEEYFYSPYPLTIVNIALNYYNSSTSKWLLSLFKMLKTQEEKGNNVFIKWFCEDGDDESQAAACEYSKLLNIPIKVIKEA